MTNLVEIKAALEAEAVMLSDRARARYAEGAYTDGAVLDAAALRLQVLARRIAPTTPVELPAVST